MTFQVTFEMSLEVTTWRAGWTWWRRRWHVLVDKFGELFEFVFAQFVVFVLIELREQFFGLREIRRRSAETTRAIGATATFGATSFRTAAAATFRTTAAFAASSRTIVALASPTIAA
jgi:hypothetical protein